LAQDFPFVLKYVNMEIDRNDLREEDLNKRRTSSSEREQDKEKVSKKPQFTKVENAHASGLGSMGRSDEKLSGENRAGQDEAVY
jgi:hypothetical protein